MPAGGIFAVVLTAAVLFAATNADDIVVLTVLSISSRASGQPRRWHIWAGQYAGFAVLIAVSLAAAAGLALIPLHWLAARPAAAGARPGQAGRRDPRPPGRAAGLPGSGDGADRGHRADHCQRR